MLLLFWNCWLESNLECEHYTGSGNCPSVLAAVSTFCIFAFLIEPTLFIGKEDRELPTWAVFSVLPDFSLLWIQNNRLWVKNSGFIFLCSVWCFEGFLSTTYTISLYRHAFHQLIYIISLAYQTNKTWTLLSVTRNTCVTVTLLSQENSGKIFLKFHLRFLL